MKKHVLGAIIAVTAALAWAGSAEAQYSSTVDTTTGVVVFTGGVAGDTLAFTVVAGFITHNRTEAGYASPSDLDSSGAVQSLMVSSLTSLTVNAGGGDDTVVLTLLTGVPGGATITINGEDGNDILTGGDAAETINGGAGNDVIEAGGGNDSVFGGAGSDLIGLGTADGESNSVDGGSDVDSLVLVGSPADNTFIISRTGGVLSISIDAAVSSASYSNLEVVSIAGLGGNDTVTVEPLDDLSYAVDGAAGADTLNIDAAGNPVVQTSSSVTVGGRLPITHSGVETVNVTNAGLSLGGDDDDSCGLVGLEALLLMAGAALLRRRR